MGYKRFTLTKPSTSPENWKGSFPYHPFPGAFCTHNINVWYILIFGCFLGKNTIPTHQIGYKIVIFWGHMFHWGRFPPLSPSVCRRSSSGCGASVMGADVVAQTPLAPLVGPPWLSCIWSNPQVPEIKEIVGKERGVQNGATICFIDILWYTTNLVHTTAQMPMKMMISSIFWLLVFG